MDFIRDNAPKIHDIASHVFWLYAADHGVRETITLVEEGNTVQLYGSSKVEAHVQRELGTVPAPLRAAVLVAITSEIDSHVRDERQLSGMIYGEDADAGRAPSAMYIDARHLNVQPEAIDRSVGVEKLGMLCIRSPLPAVVFAQREPRSAFIEVADTQRALGFPFPLFMDVHACGPGVGAHPVLLRGIFHIPVPTPDQGDQWRALIPNFTGFVSQMAIMGLQIDTSVQLLWSAR